MIMKCLVWSSQCERTKFIEKKVGYRHVAATIPAQNELCEANDTPMWNFYFVWIEKTIYLPSTNVSFSDESIECENAGENHVKIKKNNKNSETKKLCSIFFPFVSEFVTFTLPTIFRMELPDVQESFVWYHKEIFEYFSVRKVKVNC